MCHEDGLLSHDLSSLVYSFDIHSCERPMGNIRESMGIVQADTAERTQRRQRVQRVMHAEPLELEIEFFLSQSKNGVT